MPQTPSLEFLEKLADDAAALHRQAQAEFAEHRGTFPDVQRELEETTHLLAEAAAHAKLAAAALAREAT